MDVSTGTLAHLPVQYPVVPRRSSGAREGELLLASDSSRGGEPSTRRPANVTVLLVAVNVGEADAPATARPVTPARRSDGLALDPHARRGLAAYDSVLTMNEARTLGFYAVA